MPCLSHQCRVAAVTAGSGRSKMHGQTAPGREGSYVDADSFWLDDNQMASLGRPNVEQEMMQALYDPRRPSEYYRGWATVYWTARMVVPNTTSVSQAQTAVLAINLLTDAESTAGPLAEGFRFGLYSIFAYIELGKIRTLEQIIDMLDASLPVLSRCFFINRQKGI